MRLLLIATDPLHSAAPLAKVVEPLLRSGYDVFVAAPPLPGATAGAERARLGVAGWLPLRAGVSPVAVALNAWATSRWVRVLRPDLMLAETAPGGVIANLARGAAGGRVFSILLLDQLPATATLRDRFFARNAVRECDRLIVMQAHLREALVSRGARRADTLVAGSFEAVAEICEQMEREKEYVLPGPIVPARSRALSEFPQPGVRREE